MLASGRSIGDKKIVVILRSTIYLTLCSGPIHFVDRSKLIGAKCTRVVAQTQIEKATLGLAHM